MRRAVMVSVALFASYWLGTLERTARADDPARDRTAALLQQLVAIQREQAEALKAVAQAEPAQRAQREQTEALRSIAHALEGDLGHAQAEQADALRSIARNTERCVNR
jgi:hypothetical protein